MMLKIAIEEIFEFKLIDMKKVLGLDLGTNSIGWAIIVQHRKTKKSHGVRRI